MGRGFGTIGETGLVVENEVGGDFFNDETVLFVVVPGVGRRPVGQIEKSIKIEKNINRSCTFSCGRIINVGECLDFNLLYFNLLLLQSQMILLKHRFSQPLSDLVLFFQCPNFLLHIHHHDLRAVIESQQLERDGLNVLKIRVKQ